MIVRRSETARGRDGRQAADAEQHRAAQDLSCPSTSTDTNTTLGDLDFAGLEETQPDELFSAWLELSEEDRKAMEAEFREIFEMSCQKGVSAILDEARWQWRDDPDGLTAFVEEFSALLGRCRRAIAVQVGVGNPGLSLSGSIRRHGAFHACGSVQGLVLVPLGAFSNFQRRASPGTHRHPCIPRWPTGNLGLR